MNELTPRQQTILGLVVREYVKNACPISSRALVEYYRLHVSTATVRNELSLLEELGYLSHPHTSAGRVPTHKGYNHFVERLLGEAELPLQERRTIAHQFHQARPDFEQWMPLAASVLASTTSGAALVTTPQATQAHYKHLQLISTQGRSVLLVLVLRGGLVKQQMLNLIEPLNQKSLNEASDRLNQLCNELTAVEIQAHVHELPPFETDVVNLVLDIMQRTDTHTAGTVYRDGLSEVLQQPEFAEVDTAQGLMRVMEERSFLEAVLTDALSPETGSVRVLIGGEGRWDELQACSLVLARYGVTDFVTGALGIIGPTRMLYGRAISTVRFVAELLSDLVYDIYAE
ncbi:MAG: heat-inducible transcription repressor HrcA [Chloroflexi bacterium]|nr:MAG: heat-inducible transcription repressor HrcA [Anaerolineaceae bacterium 4572_32.2]RLC79924.1 MAG: heat-inducible transcription repressor HrcA [Chloroflexota bacterium]RLC85477.1 MAG: heat-inducible transcription repressor HrcA [Chloroflexota bacterium]HEY72524.1 heat-inducible transcription repressor HrcA [Thermoflexia bacterium]